MSTPPTKDTSRTNPPRRPGSPVAAASREAVRPRDRRDGGRGTSVSDRAPEGSAPGTPNGAIADKQASHRTDRRGSPRSASTPPQMITSYPRKQHCPRPPLSHSPTSTVVAWRWISFGCSSSPRPAPAAVGRGLSAPPRAPRLDHTVDPFGGAECRRPRGVEGDMWRAPVDSPPSTTPARPESARSKMGTIGVLRPRSGHVRAGDAVSRWPPSVSQQDSGGASTGRGRGVTPDVRSSASRALGDATLSCSDALVVRSGCSDPMTELRPDRSTVNTGPRDCGSWTAHVSENLGTLSLRRQRTRFRVHGPCAPEAVPIREVRACRVGSRQEPR